MTASSIRSPFRHAALHAADQAALTKALHGLVHSAHAQLILFGSRARGDAGPYADIDLAIKADGALAGDRLALAREALEQSNIPFRVDLLDYATASAALRRAIDEEGIEWTV